MYEAGTRDEHQRDWHYREGFYSQDMEEMSLSLAIECSICNQRSRKEDFESLCGCQHEFCKDCLKYYTLHKVRNEFTLIVCPKEGCNQTIQKNSSIFTDLPTNLQERYKRVEQNIKVLTNKSGKLCPDCGDQLTQMAVDKDLFCTKCVKKYCRHCLSQPHPANFSCERQAIRLMKINYSFKRCSSCQFMVEKSEGCNHMTCTCGHQFCYLCGGDWNHGNHECPKPNRYVRPRSYHVVRRQLPVRQTFSLHINNLSFNPQQLSTKPAKGHKPVPTNQKIRQFVKPKKIINASTSRKINKENQSILINNKSYTPI